MNSCQLEIQAGSTFGNVLLINHEKEDRFPFHVQSREVFNHDSTLLIRSKCLGLTFATPLVSLARSIYHLSVSMFMIFEIIGRYLDGQNELSESKAHIYRGLNESCRALSFGILLTGIAWMGIFKPLEARQAYGKYERKLNHHLDGPHRDKFYLAFCFQRIYVLSENQEMSDLKQKLNGYLDKIDTVKTALLNLDYDQLKRGLKQA